MARPRIVIVGAGFAGYHAARTLSRLSRGRAEIALMNPMDYFLYPGHRHLSRSPPPDPSARRPRRGGGCANVSLRYGGMRCVPGPWTIGYDQPSRAGHRPMRAPVAQPTLPGADRLLDGVSWHGALTIEGSRDAGLPDGLRRR
jgi:hypothetical protein